MLFNSRASSTKERTEEDDEKNTSRWNVFGGILGAMVVLGMLLLLASMLFSFSNPGNVITESSDPIPWQKAQRRFGVKILPHFTGSPYYQIVFTNNGFLTTSNLEEYMDHVNKVQLWLGSKDEAIQVAQTITSYDQCLIFNKHVQDQLQVANETITFTANEKSQTQDPGNAE